VARPVRWRTVIPARLLLPLLLLVVLGTAACGGDDGGDGQGGRTEGARAAETRRSLNGADRPSESDFPKPERGQTLQDFANSIGATGTKVGFASSVLEPGRNRVAFGVINDQNSFVYGPTAVYVARSPSARNVDGPHLAPADLLVTEPAYRSQQAATESDPFAAVYEAEDVRFPRAGDYALLVVTKVGGRLVAAPAQVKVGENDEIPDVGDKPPAVQTDTVTSAGSLEAIDTRRPPARELHEESFDQVLGKKPVTLLFATPQLCQSRVCGPVVDIALQLKAKYGDQMDFIHQEVYKDNNAQAGLREPLQQFGLPTEPWLFTVNSQGRVAARLEGSFGLNAFENAVQAALR
jgi:hypothetical protein